MGGLLMYILLLSASNLTAMVVSSLQEDDELVAVAVVFRHGDRAPTSSFPNDQYYKSIYWPQGWGQLVTAGKKRSHQLGEYLRKRYNTFISEKYKSEEIYVMSSDVDRTLMSAEALLAGLYPPVKEDIWLEDLLWQPIPVHSLQKDRDNLIEMRAECPKHQAMLEEVSQMEFFNKIRNKFSHIFKTVSEESGWGEGNIDNVETLVGTMYVYSKTNPSYIPEWYKTLDQKSLEYITAVSFAMRTHTKDIQRLKSGPFFKYLVNHFDGAIEGRKPKFLVISGHDTTIAAILNTIGCFNYEPPEFTATVIWEVYRTRNGKHYIKLLYKRNSESEAEPIQVDGCNNTLNYELFKSEINPVLISDEQWEHECLTEGVRAGTGRLESGIILITCNILLLNRYV